MKSNFTNLSIADLSSWFGVTRQAYYQSKTRSALVVIQEDVIFQKVTEIRANHPRLGGRKLFVKMRSFLKEHKIKMGRDAFFYFLRANNLLVIPI